MSKTMTFLTNIGLSFVDRFAQRVKGEGTKKAQDFTDAQVTQAVDTARQLENCKPMTKDLDSKLIKSICDKLKDSKELEKVVKL